MEIGLSEVVVNIHSSQLQLLTRSRRSGEVGAKTLLPRLKNVKPLFFEGGVFEHRVFGTRNLYRKLVWSGNQEIHFGVGQRENLLRKGVPGTATFGSRMI